MSSAAPRSGAAGWIDRATADSMGMLATVMNSIALESALEAAGASARAASAVSMPSVCETYRQAAGAERMSKGNILVLGGGTGNPFFTTDTAAVLRAIELNCDAVLKATQVDGVYSADPKKIRTRRATTCSPMTRRSADLKVMDTAAFALARENRMSDHRRLGAWAERHHRHPARAHACDPGAPLMKAPAALCVRS